MTWPARSQFPLPPCLSPKRQPVWQPVEPCRHVPLEGRARHDVTIEREGEAAQ